MSIRVLFETEELKPAMNSEIERVESSIVDIIVVGTSSTKKETTRTKTTANNLVESVINKSPIEDNLVDFAQMVKACIFFNFRVVRGIRLQPNILDSSTQFNC
ncbi:MAG: hypothetical protein EZS28_043717 [Streblomastix strix]|uniref:Uncharacterized protein n=1 Tax=Streblomastix strix TaxID=222440 RepID=A0A5J4TQJ7_9EUKA|nr:MAG: hypothetical protein EZS28_043717 [Streblomastix strix]